METTPILYKCSDNSGKSGYIFIFILNSEKNGNEIQQGLEIHGLEAHGPWRYMVFNWISKHLRYTVLGQKP